jgi:hypothetical protein
MFLRELSCKKGNILRTIAKRGKENGNGSKAEVEIPPEPPLFHQAR